MSNFSSRAEWMARFYNHHGWNLLNPNPHYIFQLPYMSAVNVDPDELHIMYLGTSLYFLGSVLWLLCYELLDGTPQENMHRVWSEITVAYKKLNVQCQFGNLNLKSFCNPDQPDKTFPKLKGKGAEVKDLVEPLYLVWDAHKSADAHDALVLSCLHSLRSLQEILHEHASDPMLPKPKAKLFSTLVQKHLQDYTRLAKMADDAERLLFNIVPKHHALFHLGARALYLNPRRSNTMMDEDFVGKMKDVVSSCAHGTPSHVVPVKVLEKYMWGKHLQWNYYTPTVA